MAVPNTFAAATSAIPLANLDANFAYYDAAYSITGTATSFTGAVTLSTGTANGVPYLNASKVLTSGAVLTFDGTILSSTRFAGALNGTVGATTANTGAFTTLTTSSTVTLNGGTANGVAYLNASKVLTTGSALTYSSSILTIDSASSGATVEVLRLSNSGTGANTQAQIKFFTTGTSYGTITGGYSAFAPQMTFDLPSASPGNYVWQITSSEQMRLTSSGLEVKQAQLIGYSSYSGLGSYGLAVAGNVGIGTSLPAGKLQVTSNNPEVYITDNSVSSPDSAALYLGIGVVTQYAGLIADFSNDLLKIRHNQATRATFDASGNLGLGVPPSASTSNYRTLQIGSTGVQYSLFGQRVGGNAETFVGWNAYGGSNTTGIGTGFYYTNSSDLASMYSQNGQHAWWIAPSGTADATISFTQAMTLDASGNLNVGYTYAYTVTGGGTTKQTVGYDQNDRTQLAISNQNAGSGASASLALGAYGADWTISNGSYAKDANSLTFTIGTNERMRLDASGNLLVGTTSPLDNSKLSVLGGATDHTVEFVNPASTGYAGLIIKRPNSTGAAIIFGQGGSDVGSVSLTSVATLYNTTSDYRLKTVIGAVSDSGSRIDALHPIEYEWNSDGSRTRGFLAHQFQEVYAGSVSGTKDSVDAEGKPVYQAMQAGSSEVIADIIAEIQDLRKRLAAAGI